MTETEVLWKALDAAQWELSEGFKGLPDEDVWKRPDPRLLSVGELAAHLAYWEAESFVGAGIESPLFAHWARYYTTSVGELSPLTLDAATVAAEVQRVHEACKAAFESSRIGLDAPNPHREGWTWRYTLIYQAFHLAYHAGQIYSVRHLLGHETVDN